MMTTIKLLCTIYLPFTTNSQTCTSHDVCPSDNPFCYDGNCSPCSECHFCEDGIDGTCGLCGDGYPTQQSSDCTGNSSPGNNNDDNNDNDITSTQSWKHEYNVFGVKVYGTETVDSTKFMHAVQVMFQYLDNDEDGNVDDPVIVDKMIENGAALAIFHDESEMETFVSSMGDSDSSAYDGYQDLYDEEIFINSCSLSLPNHDKTGCNDRYDATLEEVLHLITGKVCSMFCECICETKMFSRCSNMLETRY